jgi:hypothetical protein
MLAMGLHFEPTGPAISLTALAGGLCLSGVVEPIERQIKTLRRRIKATTTVQHEQVKGNNGKPGGERKREAAFVVSEWSWKW